MSDDEDPFAIEGPGDDEEPQSDIDDLLNELDSDADEPDISDQDCASNQDGNNLTDDEEHNIEDSGEAGDTGFKLRPPQKTYSKKTKKKNEFIDDEAELSGDDASADELESSDDDRVDTDLVDLEAKELGSDEEEDIRRLYHKQLETEDRRALLLMQEQLEDNELTAGATRRKKFRWQTKDIMENSLRRHYDPDDDDSQDLDDEEDDFDYNELKPRLRRPNAEALLMGSARKIAVTGGRLAAVDYDFLDSSEPRTYSKRMGIDDEPVAGPSTAISDDSNSNLMTAARLAATTGPLHKSSASADLNRFVLRDRELVEALSTKESIIVTREEKDRNIQRELKRVLQSKSIFDQLYS